MKTTNNDEKTIKQMTFSISAVIGLGAVIVSWLEWCTSVFSRTVSETWKILNIIPFMIAALPSNGYDFNYSIYYIMVFAQWVLITVLFLCVKRKVILEVRKRKSA
jgi:hypothetical protein